MKHFSNRKQKNSWCFRLFVGYQRIWTCVLITFLIALTFIITGPRENVAVIYIDSSTPLCHRVDEKFLSVALDTSVVASNFKHFNFSSVKLKKLINYLSPSYFRVGGTFADMLYFEPGDLNPNQNFTNFTMTGVQWVELNEFIRDVKLDLIFDLNVLIRFSNGSWNSENAEQLIKFSHDRGFRLNWELGNEPNSFFHNFNKRVNSTQLAKDFVSLRRILDKYETYKTSSLVGPDITRLRTQSISIFLKDFLKRAADVLYAITWHHYYFNGRTARPAQFLDPGTFDLLKVHIKRVQNVTKSLNLISKPLWLGETSSAWGGGAPGLSDRFIASFIWLDKLGLAAKMGVAVVIRQSIFHDHYALLDDLYNPNPDYWVSILYKLLVGPVVVKSSMFNEPTVRIYSHCAKQWSNDTNPALVVFGINLASKDAIITIDGINPDPLAYAFELTSDSLFSQTISLNGKPLHLLSDFSLPRFEPKPIDIKTARLTMLPYSICFWILRNVTVNACRLS